MSKRHAEKLLGKLKQSPKYRRLKRGFEAEQRKLQLERLEDRRVMATGPTLVNILANGGDEIYPGTLPPNTIPTRNVAPTELTFRFAEGQSISPASVGIDPITGSRGIRLIRAGLNGVFDLPGSPTFDDQIITPGYIGIDDVQREVVMRFAQTLPDDLYQIQIIGTASTGPTDPQPLRDTAGFAFNGDQDFNTNFRLDLGANITAVVPQPVERVNGALTQLTKSIDVYFDQNLNLAEAQKPSYYQLINTTTGQVTVPDGATPVVFTPYVPANSTTVPPTPAQSAKVRLTFLNDIPVGTFKLQVGTTTEPNDNKDQAQQIVNSMTAPLQSYLGDSLSLAAADQHKDVDFYRFDLTTASTLTMTLVSGTTLDGALRLFRADGTPARDINNNVVPVINTTGTGGTETFTTPVALPAGKYYVGVSAAGNIAYNAVDGTGLTTNPTGTKGSYSLRVTFTDFTTFSDDNSSFVSSTPLGLIGIEGRTVSAGIDAQPYNIVFPGAGDDPGHRDVPYETHVGYENSPGVDTIFYSFPDVYGSDPQGNDLHNAITENQKQRAREIFELYGRYLGVMVKEVPAGGMMIVTGDPRAADPNIPPLNLGGIADGRAIMNAALNWGNSEYGGGWFQVAMHEIGHNLGLGHAGDLPDITIMNGGSENAGATAPAAEPVFPGDADIIHGQSVHRPESRDIDLYQFKIESPGIYRAETVAERLVNSNLLDTVLTLYKETANGRVVIARNDNYFSSDSYIELKITDPGTYYIAVTSTGNTEFDPTVPDTGFGGRTSGSYQLKMSFTPEVAGSEEGKTTLVDATGVKIDGDADNRPTGTYDFWFQVAAQTGIQSSNNTIFVDKAYTPTPGNPATNSDGTISRPFNRISDALNAAEARQQALALQLGPAYDPRLNPVIVRIAGNGGTDGRMDTLGDNKPYLIGFSDVDPVLDTPLADGAEFRVPHNVSVMIDQGAVLKLRKANLNAGTTSQGIVDRSGGVIQVLGTPNLQVQFTSYGDDSIGGDSDGPTPGASPGDYGGIVFRDDSDYEARGEFEELHKSVGEYQAAGETNKYVFLNYVNQARMQYGGGKVFVDSIESIYSPIHLVSARPTLSYNEITKSADAAVSANPDAFDDDGTRAYFVNGQVQLVANADRRIGPHIHDNTFTVLVNGPTGNVPVGNQVNGLFMRIDTRPGFRPDRLDVSARFDDVDVTLVISENLFVSGTPGGSRSPNNSIDIDPANPISETTILEDARFQFDPGSIVKLLGSRIETRVGAQFIAEGTPSQPIIFTSLHDDRYGGSGTFDTEGDASRSTRAPGDWGGIIFMANSAGSLDYTRILYAGGLTPIEGSVRAGFNPIEIHQADVRLSNNLIQFNRDGSGGASDRNGRGPNLPAAIFVRGAQPIIVSNILRDNLGPAVSINANAMVATHVTDWGRSTGRNDLTPHLTDPNPNAPSLVGLFNDNYGPLVRLNRMTNNGTNGMVIRGAELTTETVWDDTDIAHVLLDEILARVHHTSAGIRIQSSTRESLVVKLQGASAGFTADGLPLDINDRIGGTVHIVGQPGFPVQLTSLSDDTIPAGFTPDGFPLFDTNNDGDSRTSGSGALPSFPPATGPLQITTNNNATQLVNGMLLRTLPTGVSIPSATYTGAATAAGTYANGDAVPLEIPPRGVILTSGDAQIAASNTSPGFTGANNLPGDARLSALIGGTATRDATILTITIDVAPNSGIQSGAFDFQFGSEEYSTFVGSPFNDVLGGFINNGPNFIRDSQGGLVSINSGFFDIDNEANPTFNIEYNGMTSGLTARFPLRVGLNTLVIAIADATDLQLDSGVLMTDLRFSNQDVGTGGVAGRAVSGDWRSVKLDKYSNDRNVAEILDAEPAYIGNTGDTTSTPQKAQFLGALAPSLVAGDDNRRLGFEVDGTIAYDNPADVDVYSFTADSGTEVWIDIDQTSFALDTMVELIAADGTVLARSLDNNTLNTGLANGLAQTIDKDPSSGRDQYTINPKDAGMRVILPGTNLKNVPYFVRVRSQPSNLTGETKTTLNPGLTSGYYQLQVRLRQTDEKPGSTVRYSDIRFATTGIEVYGQPYHSPLTAESAETQAAHNSFANAQNLGNILTVDRNTLSVGGNLANVGDVDWYRFDLNVDLIQSIGGLSTAGKTWPLMFDLDYTDGITRPDSTISVFDDSGRLILVGRASDIAGDQPGAGQGLDADDLSRGGFGKLDPYIGSVQLPTGLVPAGVSRTYYVAVSTTRRLPEVLDQTFLQNPAAALTRLEPIDSIYRVVDERLDATTGATASPADHGQQGTLGPLLDISDRQSLSTHVPALSLSDVTLFVTSGGTLSTVNPFNGTTEVATVGNYGVGGMNDITMRPDGRLFGLHVIGGTGHYASFDEVNPDTAALLSQTPDQVPSPTSARPYNDIEADGAGALAFQGNPSLGSLAGNAPTLYYTVHDGNVSRIYIANANTGVMIPPNQGIGRMGFASLPLGSNPETQYLTSSSRAIVTTDFGIPGAPVMTIQAQQLGALGNGIRVVLDTDPNLVGPTTVSMHPTLPNTIVVTRNPNPVPAVATNDFTGPAGSGLFTFTANAPGLSGNSIQIRLTRNASAVNPLTVNVTGTPAAPVINIDINPNTALTAQDIVTAISNNGPANALVTVTLNGAPGTAIGGPGAAITFNLANGANATTAGAIVAAINAHPVASTLVIASLTPSTTQAQNTDVTTGSPDAIVPPDTDPPLVSPNNAVDFVTAGGSGSVGRTEGIAFASNGNLYGVNTVGEFFQVNLNTVSVTQGLALNPNTGVTGSVIVMKDGLPARFSGLTRGPQNVGYDGTIANEGKYADYLFATTSDGYLGCLDLYGNLIPVFDSNGDGAADSPWVSLGLTTVPTGLAFSPLDFNLWHPTTTGGGQPGHSLDPSPTANNDRKPVPAPANTSFYFGFDNGDGVGSYNRFNYNASLGSSLAVTVETYFQGAAGQNEIQSVRLNGPPTGGTFTLTYRDQTTAPIPYNATASGLQAILEGLPSIGPGNVKVGLGGDGLSTWRIEFQGALASTNVVPLTGDGRALSLPGVAGGAINVTSVFEGNLSQNETQQVQIAGNPNAGTFFLDITIPAGTALPIAPGTYSTAAINYNAGAVAVQNAISTIVGPGNVNVTLGGTPGTWIIEFTGLLARTDLPFIVANGNGLITSGAGVSGQLGVMNKVYQDDLATNPLIYPRRANGAAAPGSINIPGGAFGSLVTDKFSLATYKATDKPTLYFDYFLDTEDASGTNMRDSIRAYVSPDGGTSWTLVATNNQTTDLEKSTFQSDVVTEFPGQTRQVVQDLHDITATTSSWRQARVDLSDFAGKPNLQIRFEFSTAGRTRAGGLTGDTNGNMHSAARYQNNDHQGVYIDNIIVGLAERGEMVIDAPVNTNFFATPNPVPKGSALPPQQVLAGAYQLEIRRGVEYGVNTGGLTNAITLVKTFDSNESLVPDIRTTSDVIINPFGTEDFESNTLTSAVLDPNTGATFRKKAWETTEANTDFGTGGLVNARFVAKPGLTVKPAIVITANPLAASSAAQVTGVVGGTINVLVSTNPANPTTAQQVVNAVNAHSVASLLVTGLITGGNAAQPIGAAVASYSPLAFTVPWNTTSTAQRAAFVDTDFNTASGLGNVTVRFTANTPGVAANTVAASTVVNFGSATAAFTAVEPGVRGNDISISFAGFSLGAGALPVVTYSASVHSIQVIYNTTAGSNSTVQQIIDAVNSSSVSALVTASLESGLGGTLANPPPLPRQLTGGAGLSILVDKKGLGVGVLPQVTVNGNYLQIVLNSGGATAQTHLGGANGSILYFEALASGAAGNDLTLTFASSPLAAGAPPQVAINGNAITVTLNSLAGSESTIQDVVDAINNAVGSPIKVSFTGNGSVLADVPTPNPILFSGGGFASTAQEVVDAVNAVDRHAFATLTPSPNSVVLLESIAGGVVGNNISLNFSAAPLGAGILPSVTLNGSVFTVVLNSTPGSQTTVQQLVNALNGVPNTPIVAKLSGDGSVLATIPGTNPVQLSGGVTAQPGTLVNFAGSRAAAYITASILDGNPSQDVGSFAVNSTLWFEQGSDPLVFENTEYYAQSGAISDGELTAMQFTQDVGNRPGYITFDWRTFTEEDHDFLRFYVDGQLANPVSPDPADLDPVQPGLQRAEWSGTDSGTASVYVTAGVHTFRWEYVKDSAATSVENDPRDTVFVDKISFEVLEGFESGGLNSTPTSWQEPIFNPTTPQNEKAKWSSQDQAPWTVVSSTVNATQEMILGADGFARVRFTAIAPGEQGNGITLNFSSQDLGIGAPPTATVNGNVITVVINNARSFAQVDLGGGIIRLDANIPGAAGHGTINFVQGAAVGLPTVSVIGKTMTVTINAGTVQQVISAITNAGGSLATATLVSGLGASPAVAPAAPVLLNNGNTSSIQQVLTAIVNTNLVTAVLVDGVNGQINQTSANWPIPPIPNLPIVLGQGFSPTSPTSGSTGTRIAKAGNISNNTRDDVDAKSKKSTLELVAVTGAGMVSFQKRVSSESNDFLRFYVDGVLAQYLNEATGQMQPTEWSGLDANFDTIQVLVDAGRHLFQWSYEKDSSLTGQGFDTRAGQDTAYIDNVALPLPQVGVSNPIGLNNPSLLAPLGIGDSNFERQQGSIQLENNLIDNAQTVGILIDSGVRDSNGNLTYPGGVRNLPTLNNDRLAPGVVVTNNIVSNFGQVGIRFSGDPNPGNNPLSAVPFGRIINNTIYGGVTATGVGIQVRNNAAPTLINNIVANTATGISVDASSTSNSATLDNRTVISANLFSGNTNNGTTGTNSVTLGAGQPLFVDPLNLNFYLRSGSQAVDSSLNSLADRESIKAVKSAVGIPESPVLAPDRDRFGQLRLDDPSQAPPPGLGQNIFKDRGAVERADFNGPTAAIVDPLDNEKDALGNPRDRNPTVHDVVIKNETLSRFVIKLSDIGVGIDDRTVTVGKFVVTYDDGVNPVQTLVPTVDYVFVYNSNSKEVFFFPVSGRWADGQYKIALDNSATTGIRDLAGNPILANRNNNPPPNLPALPGETSFTVFVGIIRDFGDAPLPYPEASHDKVDGFWLGTSVDEEGKSSRNATATGDDLDNPLGDDEDGVTIVELSPSDDRLTTADPTSILSRVDVVAPSGGFLDAWLDFTGGANGGPDGDWDDPGEHIIVAQQLTASATPQTITFSFGDKTTLHGATFARFRLSEAGVATPDGFGGNGEVEDYQVTVTGPRYQNPNAGLTEDVNGDGRVTIHDVLAIISLLQRARPSTSVDLLNPPAGLNIPASPPPYYDVVIDNSLGGGPHRNFVNIHDAIAVIRRLRAQANQQAAGGEGEGEGSIEAANGTSTNLVAASAPSSTSDSLATVYASSSVIYEAKSSAPATSTHDAAVAAVSAALTSDDPLVSHSHEEEGQDADDYFTALGQEGFLASTSSSAEEDELAGVIAQDAAGRGWYPG